ncbi:copper chaperone PCu(A)C [Streptomyces sp. CA-250714]|uniref:copper chaperone PCu(A)C n=1 Tax=Streptomyces sp. CA-250714 TaxID=3240060 RepID=UPI003D9211C7
MSEHLWRPSRRRVAEALRAGVAPVAACGIALGGLTAWAATGQAGSPARIDVPRGQVLLPYGNTTETAAFFDIENSGDAVDELVEVTSPDTSARIALSRHRTTRSGAPYKDSVASATVPARSELSMDPHSVDVTLSAGPEWRPGDVVRFTLHFKHSGAVRTTATVIPPSARDE